jgi:hypothetical protein
MDQKRLIFIISSPRSGSTMLQRMLGSHTEIFTHPEPHLLTPLNYLGYFNTVEKAPYDHINAGQAVRELVEELPRGEEDYLDALRAYTNTIYNRLSDTNQCQYFLDKTPAYGLVLPFLEKLYPEAHYVVLTRHPMAVHHSVAHSFFDGNYTQAMNDNPIVRDYVPAIGEFLRRQSVNMVRVRYEDLTLNPEAEMKRITDHIGLTFEPDLVTYGNKNHITKSFGDPMTVHKHDKPVTDSIHTWASDLKARPQDLQAAQELLKDLAPEDLEAWGYPLDDFWEPMGEAAGSATERNSINAYRVKKQVLHVLRRNIHENTLGRVIKKVRYYCDVLLRT